MTNIIKNQPVITAALAEISALTGILVAFGVDLTKTQIAAISGLGVATLTLAGLVWKLVTPVANPRTIVKIPSVLVPDNPVVGPVVDPTVLVPAAPAADPTVPVPAAPAAVPPVPTPEAPSGV